MYFLLSKIQSSGHAAHLKEQLTSNFQFQALHPPTTATNENCRKNNNQCTFYNKIQPSDHTGQLIKQLTGNLKMEG
jgi:hypothetical protein